MSDSTRSNRATEQAPEEPTGLSKRSWWRALRRTATEFKDDNLTDLAAGLTYYAVLSIFPALLVLISLLGLLGQAGTQALTSNITQVAPAEVGTVLVSAIDNLQQNQATAGIFGLVSLALALWSASGYVAAFMRASNVVYDVPEGRPIWKTLPIRVGVTLLLLVLLTISVIAVVLTGGLAERVGEFLGLGSLAVTIWDVAKWPVLLVIVAFLIALLYWASPNAKRGFRWVSPGSLVALGVWILASAAFALYVANFGSYNATYGSLAAVVIFLIWLWISNIAILLGHELNSEIERGRAVASGQRPEAEPYVELRDVPKQRREERAEKEPKHGKRER